jgi:hypothetical protein
MGMLPDVREQIQIRYGNKLMEGKSTDLATTELVTETVDAVNSFIKNGNRTDREVEAESNPRTLKLVKG